MPQETVQLSPFPVKCFGLSLFRNNETALNYCTNHQETTEIVTFDYQHYLFQPFKMSFSFKNLYIVCMSFVISSNDLKIIQ